MYYSKDGKIHHCIIKHDDIIALADYFQTLIKKDGGSLDFTINFSDDSSFSDDKIDIFSSYKYRRKDIRSIRFQYSSNYHEKNLIVTFHEGIFMAEFTNTYEIRSTDETWFNATLQEISEILSHVQKHNFLRRMFNFPWVIPSYVLYSAAVFGIMHFALGFVYGERPADHLMENVTFIPASHLYLFRILTFTAITLTICYLYPDVEFALETKRYIRRKKIRKAIVGLIGVICTIVVYPYLTNLIM